MRYNTFQGWKAQGRVVMMGERSKFRNEYNDPMFSRAQTTPIGGIETIRVYRDNRGRFVRQITTITA